MKRCIDNPAIRFAAFLCVYAIAQWHALTNAWWFFDDYARIIELEPPFTRACWNGRPLEGLWMMTLCADADGSMVVANLLLRGVQALAHVGVAYLAGSWLATMLRNRGAFWAAALFLLWPFHAEAVLWRTAGSYPIAALLGTVAVRLAWPADGKARPCRIVAAAALIVAATLLNQTGSMIVWVLPILACLGGAVLPWPPRRLAWLMAAHVAAAAGSYLITRMPEFATPRATMTMDPLAKLRLLRNLLKQLWQFRNLYPHPLPLAHVVMAVAALFTVDWKGLRWRPALSWIALALLACCIPFATILVVQEDYVTFRVMYLGPWLLVAACLLGCRQVGHEPRWLQRPRRILAIGAAFVSVSMYAWIGSASASEYVQLFAAEQQVLTEAERVAGVYGTKCVVVEEPTASTDFNPLRFAFVYGHAKVSALQVTHAARGRIERFCKLQLVTDRAAAEAAAEQGERQRPGGGFGVAFDAETHTVLILQPR